MKFLILGALACSVSISGEALCMENCVTNPVNEIVKHYNTVTPQNTFESFKKSTNELLKNIELGRDQYKDNNLLCAKWDAGVAILKDMLSVDHSSQSNLETLFTKVCDITDNGFYDVSNTVITIDASKSNLRSLFESFWQHLLQAREIAAWWVCTVPNVDIEELPYLCFEASKLLNNTDATYDALWAISILGNVSPAFWELDEEGVPTQETVDKAKKDAYEVLQGIVKDIPSINQLTLLLTD